MRYAACGHVIELPIQVLRRCDLILFDFNRATWNFSFLSSLVAKRVVMCSLECLCFFVCGS
jgi:hypothetical protein